MQESVETIEPKRTKIILHQEEKEEDLKMNGKSSENISVLASTNPMSSLTSQSHSNSNSSRLKNFQSFHHPTAATAASAAKQSSFTSLMAKEKIYLNH
jgi:hypothetical protein